MHQVALGNRHAKISMNSKSHMSGDSWVSDNSGDTDLITLDSLNLENVDLIKIDVQGTEIDVVKGGVETIKRNKPIMIVEQKGLDRSRFHMKPGAATTLLMEWGAKPFHIAQGDWIMGWS
jgi:hypothetical protein